MEKNNQESEPNSENSSYPGVQEVAPETEPEMSLEMRLAVVTLAGLFTGSAFIYVGDYQYALVMLFGMIILPGLIYTYRKRKPEASIRLNGLAAVANLIEGFGHVLAGLFGALVTLLGANVIGFLAIVITIGIVISMFFGGADTFAPATN